MNVAELDVSLVWAKNYPESHFIHKIRLERKGFVNYYATKKDLTNHKA